MASLGQNDLTCRDKTKCWMINFSTWWKNLSECFCTISQSVKWREYNCSGIHSKCFNPLYYASYQLREWFSALIDLMQSGVIITRPRKPCYPSLQSPRHYLNQSSLSVQPKKKPQIAPLLTRFGALLWCSFAELVGVFASHQIWYRLS